MIELITDEMAVEIADLAANKGCPREHQVIDRIDGICVGLFGKYQDELIVQISESDETVIIYRYDNSMVRPIRRIYNKGIIIRKLRECGIQRVEFNKVDDIQTRRDKWLASVHELATTRGYTLDDISRHFSLDDMFQYFIDNNLPVIALKRRINFIANGN